MPQAIQSLLKASLIQDCHSAYPGIPMHSLAPLRLRGGSNTGSHTQTALMESGKLPPSEAYKVEHTTALRAIPNVSHHSSHEPSTSADIKSSAQQFPSPNLTNNPCSSPKIKLETIPHYFEPNGVPVFKPTFLEFNNFKRYVQSIAHYGERHGLVKIIPPKEWKAMNPTDAKMISKFKIKAQINQEFNAGGLPSGASRVFNVTSKKVYTVREWFKLSNDADHSHPVLLDAESGIMAHYLKEKKKARREKVEDDMPLHDIMRTPSEFDAVYLSHLERHYWRNLSFNRAIYAADLYGSLFNQTQDNQWNVARLENILQHYTHPIPGVNLPMLYFGMYGSSFAWHLEDYDLCSIKYICLNLATYTLELQNNGTLYHHPTDCVSSGMLRAFSTMNTKRVLNFYGTRQV
jgi:jmjN domain